MKTAWVYNSSVRYKTCSKTVRQMLDREYKLDARNERPVRVKAILWNAKNKRNCEEFL
jgi:hypothetical protein